MKTKKPRWVPRIYQMFAVCFLLSTRFSALFLDPGLGKTSITLAVLRILKFTTPKKKRTATLLVAPKSVIWLTWPNELKKWRNFEKLSFCILHGNMKEYLLWNAKSDIYLINPNGLVWLHDELLKGARAGRRIPFNVLWVDESTEFKNPTAPTLFKTLEPMLPLFKRRHIMTGTPAAKAYEDLWSQIFILDRGKALEDNYYKFRQKYFVNLAKTIEARDRIKLPSKDHRRRQWIVAKGVDLKSIIAERIAHLVLDMSEKEYLDLPPLVFNPVYVELPAAAMNHYKDMEKDTLTYIEEHKISAKAAINAMIPCWQIANGSVYESVPEEFDDEQRKKFLKTRKVLKSHTAKVDTLVNLVKELNGKPLVVVYWFKHDLAAIEKAFGKVPALNSSTSHRDTVRIEKAWNAGKLPLLAGHPSRIAMGLNLQDGGTHMTFFSLFWKPDLRRHALKRLHRSGQTKTVTIHDLIARGTIDEVMYERWHSREIAETKLRKLLTKYRKEQEANVDTIKKNGRNFDDR